MDTKKEKREYTVEEIDAMIARLHQLREEKTAGAPKKATANVATTQYFVEDRVRYYLNALGVPQSINGYKYLCYGLKMAVEEELLLESITKGLYPLIAKKFETTSSRVERSIRHAVEVAWDRCDLEVMVDLFGNTISNTKGKPTNSEFLALISNRIRTEWMRHLENSQ